jgi:glycosyltransferase involved in cell wall biosynthesis
MLTRAVNCFVTRIVANSEAARTIAVEREGVHPDKIDVLYNGVDVDKFHPAGLAAEQTELPIRPEARVVGIVANYRPVKNLTLFLRAAAIVAREIPDTWFLLVGTGAMENSLPTTRQ